MSMNISIDEAQARLSEIISKLHPGEEVVITKNQQPVARLLAVRQQTRRKLGTMQGTVKYMAPDFDAPLNDFKEYML